MRYFYDCEFLEDGRTITLLSIGIVAEDGREYYAVNADMPVHRVLAHDFLRTEVWPHLPRKTLPDGARGRWEELDRTDPRVKDPTVIADEVQAFLLASTPPELWAWYAAFDHVCLAWLWGPMIELPEGIPMFTRDLRDRAERLGNPALPEQADGHHDALADARHNLVRHRALDAIEHQQTQALRGYVDAVCPECRAVDTVQWSNDDDDRVTCRSCGWEGRGDDALRADDVAAEASA